MAASAAALCGVLALQATPASAASADTSYRFDALDEKDADLIAAVFKSCETDNCNWRWSVNSRTSGYGDLHQVADSLANCSTVGDTSSLAVAWSDTTGSSDTLGVSTALSAGLFDIVQATLTVSYNHTWTRSHTETQTTTVSLAAGHAGTIYRRAPIDVFTGTATVSVPGKPVVVVIENANFTLPSGGKGIVVTDSDEMTPAEWAEYCPA
ncbi:hypothetical protein [Streptomyces sp. NPDC059013]